MKILNYIEQHIKILVAALVAGSVMLLTAGCSEVDGGTVQSTIQLPTDSVLNFACADEGIYLEPCVLDNPENPYANVAITADDFYPASPNDKFVLNDAAPSAKARYYLWATALAKGAGIPGENQYYTAVSLHEVYAESGSPTTRAQALKAYRSVLDNYFLNPTFFGPFTENEIFFAAALKDLVGQNLVDTVPPLSLEAPDYVPLYDEKVEALGELSDWGYIYNETTKVITFFQ
jgi:hypothetical protein